MEEKDTKHKSLQNKSYESLGCLLMARPIVGISQRQFTTTDSNSYTPYIKNARVVTSMATT